MPTKIWDEITYPFPNFNGATVDVWEWMIHFIPHFVMDVMIMCAGIKVKPGVLMTNKLDQFLSLSVISYE